MKLDIKTLDMYDIYKIIPLILDDPNKYHMIIKILNREDAKDIIEVIFRHFLMKPSDFILSLIANKEYKDIFDSLIKKNIVEIIYAAIKSKNVCSLIQYSRTYSDLILENFDMLIEDDNFIYNMHVFLRPNNTNDVIIKHKDLILKRLIDKVKTNTFTEKEIEYLTTDFFIYLEDFSKSYIKQNEANIIEILNYVIKRVDVSKLNEFYGEHSNFINGFISAARKNDSIDKILNDNIDLIVSIFSKDDVGYLKKEKIMDDYVLLIKDILASENVDLKDIKACNGGFSNVLIIGDKVMKVGFKSVSKVPYDKRILQPIVSTLVNGKSYCNGMIIDAHKTLEVFERVDTDNITDEDAYQVFKELLEKGKLWADAAPRNLGRLLKPNKVYVKDAYKIDKEGKIGDYYVDDNDVGIIATDEEKEILPAGEFVICDKDELYDIKKFNLIEKLEDMIRQGSIIDQYRIDFTLSKECNISPATDYLDNKYLKRYIEELKQKINTRKKF